MLTPQEFHQSWLFCSTVNVLFLDRVYGAIAHSAFPDNARAMSALQVIALDFNKFMCFCVTISVIILYPFFF
ncbi:MULTISPECIES: hypothetical protein [unclassified Microcoleus]|uniref:hypothetical protein n=1 Tax=unclassified Microcoleus TaxID=2642155 RepID=UPI002FD6F535